MLLSNHIHRKKGTHPRDTNQVPLANPTFEFETLYSAWSSVVYMGCPGVVADWNPAGIHNSLSLSGRPGRLPSLTDRPGFPDLGRLLLSPPTDYPTLHIPEWSRSRSESLLSFSTAAKSIKLDRKHGK